MQVILVVSLETRGSLAAMHFAVHVCCITLLGAVPQSCASELDGKMDQGEITRR